ncbi:YceI family protein [Parvibaculum sp.]|uniref:YceI family protein n=1 Tax=Parvibaculum sp. TaxID=2024848 RepID=UPI003BA9419D
MGATRIAGVLVVAASLSACTAFNVATHRVSGDPVDAPGGTYRADPQHTSVTFDVDHLGFSRFVARFNEVAATLEAVPGAPEKSKLDVTIKAASVDTNVVELDRMLTGSDFFNAARYPDIRFVSTSIVRTSQGTGEVAGDLTMAGQTHPARFTVTFNGAAPDPLTGADKLGFSAEGTLDRSEWGLANWWPAVGNEVRFHIEAEFTKPES